MKAIIAPFLFILLSFAPVSIDLQTLSLMDKVTIGLPGTAEDDVSYGLPMKKVVMKDKTTFFVSNIDFTKLGMTEDMLQLMLGTDQFKEQMEGFVGMQKGVKLVKNEAGKYKDKYMCYDIVLDIDQEEYKGIAYQKMVFYKNYCFSMIYIPGKDGNNDELKNQVFNSLKIAE